jgi:cytochrome c peroxidase
MRGPSLAGGAVAALIALAGLGAGLPSGPAPWRADELARIATLGPWPPPEARDASNRVSGRAEAVALGEALFHSTRLSTVGGLRCASCHAPWRRFTDGRPRALGAAAGARNTPTLLDVRLQRWFGWDGGNDTLWAQSIRPILDPREMHGDAARVAAALRDDATLRPLYVAAFGGAPPADDQTALVDAGKALAAYQETLVSGRTPFDAFRDALGRGDAAAAARYPVAAQRGLRVFIGAGGCVACHAGPGFSDGDFHASRIVSTRHDGARDTGRAHGLETLRTSAYARAGRFADGDRATQSMPREAPAGAFRTPGLREIVATAPYMHDGSVASLCEAVQPHAAREGQAAPRPLTLAERRDVVAFLRSLGDAQRGAALVDAAALACR